MPDVRPATGLARVLWTEPRNDRPDLLEQLRAAGCDVRLGNDYRNRMARIDEGALIEAVADVDGLLVGGRDRFSHRVLEAAPRLIAISKSGVGTDRIDVAAATRLGVAVTNTAGLRPHRDGVAEHTVALMLGLAKNLLGGDARARAGDWRVEWNTLLAGKTVGIIGYGRVGRRVADLLAPWGVHLLAHDPVARVEPPTRGVNLDVLLGSSDIVTLHAVRVAGGQPLLSRDAIAGMKPGALVVNTARGRLVDQPALVEGLRSGHVGGAALDVFASEPLAPSDHVLIDEIRDRVLLSPHRAGSVPEAREATGDAMVQRHLQLLSGTLPDSGLVNPEVAPRWRGLSRSAPLAAAP